MLKLNTNFESVFDTIETSQPTPLPFIWKPLAITSIEPIMEINLVEMLNDVQEESLYKIYPNAISKCKVFPNPDWSNKYTSYYQCKDH